MKFGNPFESDPRYRLELAYKKVPGTTKSLLDFGCSDGLFLEGVKNKAPTADLIGIDVDDSKLKVARKRVKGKFIKLKNEDNIPLKSESVEIVTLLDVLEHVPDQYLVISEINRVLFPRGTLFLSVPHKGITEIFDPGNIKFRFPMLHKFLYEKVFKQKGFVQKYKGENQIGDISMQDVMWHKHYNIEDLKKILGDKFKIEKVCYYALLFPIISMFDQAIRWLFKVNLPILPKVILWDSRTNFGKLSFSIFIIARKI